MTQIGHYVKYLESQEELKALTPFFVVAKLCNYIVMWRNKDQNQFFHTL